MILVLKSADRTTQIWLLEPGAQSGEPQVDWESGRQLSDELHARLMTLVESRGHQLGDITGCVIFSGPGSFTSLRIGHATLNALADGLGIPVVGASGENWMEVGLEQLKKAQPGRPAVPEYGAEAHITAPKA